MKWFKEIFIRKKFFPAPEIPTTCTALNKVTNTINR